MRFEFHLLALFVLLTSCYGKSQDRLVVNIPTAAVESAYVWNTIQDIKFFEENNYQVSLPEGQLIEDLKVKSKKNILTDEDYERLKFYIQDSIYDKSNYLAGYEKIKNELILINKMIGEIKESNFEWDFKKMDTYQINLTLYGPGGSYNPDDGSILIFTTPKGAFKNYDNPANTIIHEITHIGMEASIVNKFKTPHALKERIVDTFVSLNFKQYLPDYKIQDMGDSRIDQYLKAKKDLNNLHKFVRLIMEEEE